MKKQINLAQLSKEEKTQILGGTVPTCTCSTVICDCYGCPDETNGNKNIYQDSHKTAAQNRGPK
jgi:hypothetical protein